MNLYPAQLWVLQNYYGSQIRYMYQECNPDQFRGQYYNEFHRIRDRQTVDRFVLEERTGTGTWSTSRHEMVALWRQDIGEYALPKGAP